jgi:hypothetical protein
MAHNVSGVYEVGELVFRPTNKLPKQNSSTKAECLVASPNLINTLLAVVAVIQDKLLKNDRVRLQTQNAGYRNRILASKKAIAY